jgi:hypothetical protein
MRLQNETLDGSCNPSWWELMRRRLLTLFPSYRPERHLCAGRGRNGERGTVAREYWGSDLWE